MDRKETTRPSMKTKTELERDILNLTMKMHLEFPELSTYIADLLGEISEKRSTETPIQKLKEYYTTLDGVLIVYSETYVTEKPEKNKETIEFPGYSLYPASEDIYSKGKKEMALNPEDLSKNKTPNAEKGTMNEKDFQDDMSGSDLDVPGSELDDAQEKVGSEDEENNYYSLGGDAHNDLDEDNG